MPKTVFKVNVPKMWQESPAADAPTGRAPKDIGGLYFAAVAYAHVSAADLFEVFGLIAGRGRSKDAILS